MVHSPNYQRHYTMLIILNSNSTINELYVTDDLKNTYMEICNFKCCLWSSIFVHTSLHVIIPVSSIAISLLKHSHKYFFLSLFLHPKYFPLKWIHEIDFQMSFNGESEKQATQSPQQTVSDKRK